MKAKNGNPERPVYKRTQALAVRKGQRVWPRRLGGRGWSKTPWVAKGRNSEGELVIAQGRRVDRLSAGTVVLTLLSDDEHLG